MFLRVCLEMLGGVVGTSENRMLFPMVPLPYPRLLDEVSLIYPSIQFWERPVYTLFALYGGGGWQYG